MSDGFDLKRVGWTRLSYQFSEQDLGGLSSLNIHEGRGRRLPNMPELDTVLPDGFKDSLRNLGFDTMPNRAVGFVKSKDHNWSLPWHQDRVVAMSEKSDNPAYKNWSRKSGVWHCEPETKILQDMAFAYIAFDSLDESSGGLQIAEATHLSGKIPEHDIKSSVDSANCVLLTMARGDILLISALTLHRSAPTQEPVFRRTFRMDFAKTGVIFP